MRAECALAGHMSSIQRLLRHTDLLLGLGLIAVVGILIIPLPHWLLDLGLVMAIGASVVILLAAVNVTDPLQFSVFPSLLLITTLYRLALSIAATKLILGTAEAGHVIETFGSLVMGGDFIVGFVAFLILVVVQFVVITNGAGRVSEVVARFTLDAMPGKQMAIDADLAAGIIDDEEAKQRRKQIKQEADFYGAMDGASKFVKGDAIASILIILINIIGGLAVGFLKGQGDAMTILRTYALLSVGEGLVSQLPALLISTASGLMVTRAGQERSMGAEVTAQLLGQPRAMLFAAISLGCLAFVPGFPATIFLGVAVLLYGLYSYLKGNPNALRNLSLGKSDNKPDGAKQEAKKDIVPQGPEAVLPLLGVDPLEIEIGYGLTKLADPRVGGDLADRVSATRRQIAMEIGFVMPTVRIRDSIHLRSNEYVLKVRGEEVNRSEVMPDRLLAVNSGAVIQNVAGIAAKDPVFGLDALWVEAGDREAAERAGFTVIEPSAVLSTHLSEVVRAHAADLLSRQDVQTLLDNAKAHDEAVVNELVNNVLQVGDIQKVLQHLLREKVPIRDMVTILETMADFGSRVKDPEQLGELVRAAISRTITRQYLDDNNKLYCITLEPAVERDLAEKVNVTSFGSMLVLDPDEQRHLVQRLQSEVDRASAQGYQAVLICSTQLRLPLRRLAEKSLPSLPILAYNEVAEKAEVEFVGQVKAA
ncbi:MAG: flagellar biosynthesis protein FlhA [Armatimonadetes bacterium]|nr:flagellar biosynthesis protein FlhA [Armatimonadota bacterium]NOG38058.1 flagellar biosynthesis protein FlhA [Armatimonadota bacterium]GIK31987.1 MAG: flagellar biosynthesis protein FlhA [Armatimonadota bacterium]